MLCCGKICRNRVQPSGGSSAYKNTTQSTPAAEETAGPEGDKVELQSREADASY